MIFALLGDFTFDDEPLGPVSMCEFLTESLYFFPSRMETPSNSLFIPALTSNSSKGDAGRVAIIGGSKEYTGAPYFAGISSLKTGADLVHIYCVPEAAQSIKGYSPDLIVHPDLLKPEFRTTENIQRICRRIDCLVVGPGMGRDHFDIVGEILKEVLKYKDGNIKAVIIDADGLGMIERDLDLVRGHECVILTPNTRELDRLASACGIDDHDRREKARKLSKELDLCVFSKGDPDFVSYQEKTLDFQHPGTFRRCGGQGDILAGCLATFMCWNPPLKSPALLFKGAAAASALVRLSGKMAFEQHGRSMLASNVVSYIGKSFQKLFGE